MKEIRYLPVLLAATILPLSFSGCGEEPVVTKPVAVETKTIVPLEEPSYVQVIPVAKSETPRPEWIGTITEFSAVFEERDSPDPDKPLDFPRLFVRSSDSAYTGSIARLNSNQTLEYSAGYLDGYVDGVARWWDGDGILDTATLVRRGIQLDGEVPDDAEKVRSALLAQRVSSSHETVVPTEPVFVGNNDALSSWTTSSPDGNYLIDKRTGKAVTGGLQVYDEVGRMSYYSEYKDGKLHGRNDHWHSNGIKREEAKYANGVKHGIEIWRDENGLKTYQANYVQGKLHGIMTCWDNQGRVSSQRRFEEDKLVDEILVQP